MSKKINNQKILQNSQIDWFDGSSTRLNYQMIFNDSAKEEKVSEEPENQENLDKILRERDKRWKTKLKVEREKAFNEGVALGKQEGLEQAREEMEEKFAVIREAIEAGHKEWKMRQEILEPGLLDMVFEISESILGIPVENPEIRNSIEKKLTPILQKIDKKSKPLLWVAEEDFDYIKDLIHDFSESMVVNIQSNSECNPGEFRLETNEETIVHEFREMLVEFRKSLNLPSWK